MNEQDWDAVASAISERMDEVHIGQRQLADLSGVSAATIRELTYNYKPRRRPSRTLKAISVGLGWPPEYLESVLHSSEPVTADVAAAGAAAESKAVSSQLVLVLQHLEEIRKDLRELKQNFEAHKQ